MKPTISCFENGPYVVKNLTAFRDQDNNAIECKPTMAICRCGHSNKKPFCDAEHRKIGFSDENTADKDANKEISYAGQQLTIHDNRAACAHVGFCTDQLANCFRHKQDPWIHPDAEDVEKVIEVIRKCPSGALSYSINDEKHNVFSANPSITIIKGGPLAVTGGIELLEQTFANGVSTEHYTLCRCGASKNKPFCDGSHWNTDFKD